jgi:transcription initiation factor TFIIH subunit 3
MTSPLISKSTPPSLLLVILDIHPLSWSLLSTESPSSLPAAASDGTNGNGPSASHAGTSASIGDTGALAERIPSTPLPLSEFITNLLVFLNAHLASRWGNQVVFFAAAPGRSKLLYPSPKAEETSVQANVYHPFRLLNAGLEEGLREMVKEEEERFARDEGRGLNGMS